MRKKISIVLLVSLIITLLFGCSEDKLVGTYVDEMDRKLTFEGSERLEFMGFEGSYKIQDDKITIVLDEETAYKVQEYSFTEMDDSLIIDGVEYKKAE